MTKQQIIRKYSVLFFSLFLALAITSCKKYDDDGNSAPKTKTELLTAKTWMYDEYS